MVGYNSEALAQTSRAFGYGDRTLISIYQYMSIYLSFYLSIHVSILFYLSIYLE